MSKNAACVSFVRASVMAVFGTAAILLWSSSLLAAEEKKANKEDEELSEVQVTGTRIQNPNVKSANPITSISGEDMRRLGIVNVADALTQLVPQNVSTYAPFAVSDTRDGVAGGNQDGVNRAQNFVGATIANLRGLDPAYGSRTLTMIDGRRVVSTSNQADVVDMNIIPSNLLERMDVVTGGASATYGSGAMAGVVNLVLNRRLTGLNIDMDYGITEIGDGGSPHVSISGGTPLFEGKGHILFGGEYQNTAAIRNCAESRAWCRQSRALFTNGNTFGVATTAPLTGQVPGFTTNPANFQVENIRYSQFSQNGVIYLTGQPFATSAYRFTADGTNVEPYALGYRGGNGSGNVMNGDGPVVTSGTSLQAGSLRKTGFTNFEYDFTSRTTGYLQASYATTTGTNKNTYTTSTNCVRFNQPGVVATAPATAGQGTVFLGSDPALTNSNFKAYLGIAATSTAAGFGAPYWVYVGATTSPPNPATFAFRHINNDANLPPVATAVWGPVQNIFGGWWYQLQSVTVTDPAGFSDPGNPAVLPTLGRNAYAFLNNLAPAALEQVQRGAFAPTNGIPNTAYTSPTTGAVPSYLTGANPCQGFTPVRKVWNPQFNQFTKSDNDTLRGVIGVRGRFGGDWKWETYYQYGQTKSLSDQNNALTQYRLNWAMDAVVDDRVGSPTYGTPVCRVTRDGLPTLDTSGQPVSDPASLQALAAGCKAINIFGTTFGTTASMPGYTTTYNPSELQKEAIAYSFVDNRSAGKTSQHDFSITTSGTLWDGFGAGPLTGAFGFEGRQDEVNNPGSLGVSYERFDLANSWNDQFGGRTRTLEGYTELNMPLITGLDGIERWSVDAAVRYSSIYNKGLAGTTRDHLTQSTPNWKFSTEFAPFDWVRFRLTRSEDLRAAGYRDLFIQQASPGGPDFATGANPWRARTLESNENQTDRFGYIVVGNPLLKPEKSNTLTLGLVLSPGGWAQGMNFTADYYNIRVSRGIFVSYGAANPITACWAGSGNIAQGVDAAGNADPSQPGINGKYDPNVEACRAIQFAQITPKPGYDPTDVSNLNLQDITNYSYAKPSNNLPYQRRGLDLSWSYMFPLARAFEGLPGSVSLTLRGQRALESSGSSNAAFITDNITSVDEVGQIRSSAFIPGVTPTPKWTGNIITSYLVGDFTTSLSARYIGGANLDNTWCDTPGEACYKNAAGQFLTGSVDNNHVNPYFNFALNASYALKVANLKRFEVFGSVNNLFDKSPPYTAGYVSGASPQYNDTLGRAYRAGVRMKF